MKLNINLLNVAMFGVGLLLSAEVQAFNSRLLVNGLGVASVGSVAFLVESDRLNCFKTIVYSDLMSAVLSGVSMVRKRPSAVNYVVRKDLQRIRCYSLSHLELNYPQAPVRNYPSWLRGH